MLLYDLNLIPTITMTFEEKLNAILRLFLFLGLISALIFNDIRYILFIIILFIFSIFIYKYYENTQKQNEDFLNSKDLDIIDNRVCVKPTINNPFMNPSLLDYQTDNNLINACDINNSKINKDMHANFNKNIYKDVNDIYGKQTSERQFYTVPSTIIPNDQEGYAKWLYYRGKTCKENNGLQCVDNIM